MGYFTDEKKLESWSSGLRRFPAKEEYLQNRYQEFKSLTLHQLQTYELRFESSNLSYATINKDLRVLGAQAALNTVPFRNR